MIVITYLERDDDNSQHKTLVTPWQAVGAKAVTALAEVSQCLLSSLPRPRSLSCRLMMTSSVKMLDPDYP